MQTPFRAIPFAIAAFVLAGGLPARARADEPPVQLVRTVESAESDPRRCQAALVAVMEAIDMHPKDSALYVLKARVLLADAKTKKASEKAAAFDAVFEALAEATDADPWDPAPFRLKVRVYESIGRKDVDAIQEALRAIAIRSPGDAQARAAFMRISKDPPRLRAGDPMPRVTWMDSQGNNVTAQSLWSKGPVVVELFRSSTWCPYCQKHILYLHDAADRFEKAKIGIVACSPEPPERLADIEKNGLKDKKPFRLRLLSDPGGRMADALGVLNEDSVKKDTPSDRYGLPHPTTIIVDGLGIVRFIKSHGDIRDRVKVEEMLDVANSLERGTPQPQEPPK